MAGRQVCIRVRVILPPAPRHDKSSRGTPRLRRLPGSLQGASRLAARTTTMILDLNGMQMLDRLDLY